ncbi:hypothetical protein [Nonomuraea recticatena]|uniref:Uncharacterized protein n=1 Tax=Nonomuraea recticatena TaxID=46178 RepID=A0ABN3T3V3_9ACTN
MSQISINQACGDGCADQVTINVNCTCKPPSPGPASSRLAEASLYGYAASTGLPPHATYKLHYPTGPFLLGATAILPAGVSLASIGIGVLESGEGEMTGLSRLAVYIGGVAEKAGQTEHLPNLFAAGTTGWRWANLEAPVPAADADREVWLVAQVPSFATRMPTFLSSAPHIVPGFVNGLRARSVMVQGLSQLPPIFDGDAVQFTPRSEIPLMAGLSTPIAQP